MVNLSVTNDGTSFQIQCSFEDHFLQFLDNHVKLNLVEIRLSVDSKSRADRNMRVNSPQKQSDMLQKVKHPTGHITEPFRKVNVMRKGTYLG